MQLIIPHTVIFGDGDEWKALRNLADDRRIVMKGADKDSSVVI